MESNNQNTRHVLTLLVDNEPGVLARISGLFSGRGFNIESLCVAETEDPEESRITLVTSGRDEIVEQIKKQLNRLINVIKVIDMNEVPSIQREMALVKVNAMAEQRAEILRNVELFRARVINVSHDSYIIELTGSKDKISAFLDLMRSFGIRDLIRTGIIAMRKDNNIKRKENKRNGKD